MIGNWRYRVKIKHLLTKSEEPNVVRQSMSAIADVLEANPCFAQFSTAPLRKIPDGDEIIRPVDYANKLLDRLYDYADERRIWIE